MKLQIISAGAGSGKTYRLTNDMADLLNPENPEKVRANGIFATTFTNKAAAELQERVRLKLLEDGLTAEADALAGAMIGTVHSLGLKLLKRFAFEAGVSPQADILPLEDSQLLFNQSLATVLNNDLTEEINALAERLACYKDSKNKVDWRKAIQDICDAARSNNFSKKDLLRSCKRSISSLLDLMPTASAQTGAALNAQLKQCLDETIDAIESNEADSTKTTSECVADMRVIQRELQRNGKIYWYEWAKLSKIQAKVAKKSTALLDNLTEMTNNFPAHPDFRNDIAAFSTHIFTIAVSAIEQFDAYKKARGLIDYTDMEVNVLQLLNNEAVCEVLKSELDLLLVDEFQDTNPIQLSIFLKLTDLARKAIWVGDPKQSIYGFRGSDPALMEAVVKHLGGVKPENILGNSWRSRADLVNLSNALFVKAFAETIPQEQVALSAVRRKTAEHCTEKYHEHDSFALANAVHNWHFKYNTKKLPAKWLENCTAERVRELLESDFCVADGKGGHRALRPNDIAFLCKSNAECANVAAALQQQGIRTAMAQTGLLNTPEVRLVLASLRYILHRSDTLSVAEILRLGLGFKLSDLIADRSQYLEDLALSDNTYDTKWAGNQPFLTTLSDLRPRLAELSGYEIISYILEELDIRRIVAAWGNTEARLNNIDILRKFALEYENNCTKAQTAASLGGLLLWLNKLNANDKDAQGAESGGDAVQILTYHASKGLEWSVTVCMSLDGKLRDRVFGVNIMTERTTFDINDPLGGRWLRFWHNPLADQLGKTLFEMRINESEIKRQAEADALSEEARVLYVGLTRARDFLILPTAEGKGTKWLNRVWHNGNEDLPTFTHGEPHTPFVWEDNAIPMHSEVLERGNDFETHAPEIPDLFFRAERSGRMPYDALQVDLAKALFKIKTTHFASAPTLPIALPETDMEADDFWAIVHDFIQFDLPIYKADFRKKTLDANLKKIENAEFVTTILENKTEFDLLSDKILAQAEGYYQHIQSQYFANANISKMNFTKNPPFKDKILRKFEAVFSLDLCAQYQQKAVLVAHHFSADLAPEKLQSIAREQSTPLAIARLAFAQSHRFPLQNIVCLMYFPQCNGFVEVAFL
jgi:ATP-dependent helicase/nuclease subunit A